MQRYMRRDLREDGPELPAAELRMIARRLELAVEAKHGRLHDPEVDVARAQNDGTPQHSVHIHGQLVHRHERRGA